MHITYDLPVAIDDIIEAKQRLAGRIYKTGMPRSNYFSERCKGEIFLKFENMQRTGSFKIRGAFNKLSSLTDAEKRKGVVACSAGNHAQGVSLSCAGNDSNLLIVFYVQIMPDDFVMQLHRF
ncbi:pyridoxal-phosphate dependent enzyme [Escherichia coli]|uniref:pyridoxal-phosphate dependent enzyme n=1 Tax=Escherichia coli TaxID=562 RepID=UPI0035B0B2CE